MEIISIQGYYISRQGWRLYPSNVIIYPGKGGDYIRPMLLYIQARVEIISVPCSYLLSRLNTNIICVPGYCVFRLKKPDI